MSTLLDLLKEAIEKSNDDRPHEHVTKITGHSLTEPLPCGADYVLRFFSGETTVVNYAFSAEGLIEFRDAIVNAVEETLTASRPAVAVPVDAVCTLCQQAVSADSGFETPIGWMHFSCDVDTAADSC